MDMPVEQKSATRPIRKAAWLHFEKRDGKRKVLFARPFNKEIFINVGGKLERGESYEAAVAREVKEETGAQLIPSSIKYLLTTPRLPTFRPGEEVEIKCFTADFTGKLVPLREIHELRLLSSEDGHLTTEAGRFILKALKRLDLID